MKTLHLKRRKGGNYEYRRRVPDELIQAIGRKEISKSLGTSDIHEASRLARVEALKWDQEFAHQRALLGTAPSPSPELSPEELSRLTQLYIAQLLEEDEEHRLEGLSDREYTALQEAYGIVGAETQWALSRGRPDLDDFEVSDFLESQGILLDRTTEHYRRVSIEFLKARSRALEMLRARHSGEVIDTPDTAPLLHRRDTKEDSLEYLMEYWEAQPAKSGGVKSRTARAEARTIIRKFREMVGDLRPSQIKKSHAVLLKDKMLEAGSSAATINKGRAILAAIFSTAYDNGKLQGNPFADLTKVPLEKSTEKKYYTIEELQRIFDSPIFTQGARPDQGRGEAAFWLPLLGLFSGARLNEVGQLFVEDVGQEDGIAFMEFKHDPKTGRTTKDKKNRRVPIHPALLELGFLDYAAEVRAQKGERLFPLLVPTRRDGKGADKWGQQFWSKYVREVVGIERIPMPFHALRHCFTEYGRKVGMPYEHRMRMEGHSMNTVGDKTYGDSQFPLEPLLHSLKMLTYEGLSLDHLRKG